MKKQFASQADLEEKKTSFVKLSDNAYAYTAEGDPNSGVIIASRGTYELVVERGEQDMKSEIKRFPRLFAVVQSVPGLTWPTMVFEKEMTNFMGKLEVKLMHHGGNAGRHL